MKPLRRRMGKAQKQRAARRGGYAMLRRLPQNLGAIGIGNNEARAVRHDFDRHVLRNGKVKSVAMGAIVLPFAVGTEVRDRGFDFDDMDCGIGREGDDIGAPPREKRQFGEGREVEPPQQPPGAAGNKERPPRLAGVLRRERLEQTLHYSLAGGTPVIIAQQSYAGREPLASHVLAAELNVDGNEIELEQNEIFNRFSHQGRNM
jgi:hypothetical protein